MGWKSIEMQVALPRTQDAGKIQEQLQKQSEQMQGALTQTQLEQEKLKRARVNHLEEMEKLKLKKETEESKLEHEEFESQEEDGVTHPYLGNKVDIRY